MDELEKAMAVALRGPQAARAITDMHAQVIAWGMKLPDTEPFVCDFGLGDFDRVGEIEVWIANEVREGYCGKFLFVKDGQTCPLHRHAQKHETFFVVKGQVSMCCGTDTMTLSEGATLPVCPGTVHSFTGMGPALLLEISCPCVVADNFFEDRRIPFGGNFQPGMERCESRQ